MKTKLFLGVTAVISAFSFAAEGDAYTWPTYRSDLDYDTKTNIGNISAPTKFSTDCDGVTGQKAGEWWAFYWGKDRDPRVTDETIDSLLKKYDTDFAYLRDVMGWAPDRRAQKGEYSAVYYYGSGTCAGGSKTDTLGGWQSNVGNRYYEAVAASFYPVYSFNPKCTYHDRVAQMDAMVHEGIHSMTKAYPGAQNAHWFQEGGNTWIQQEMAARRNNGEAQHSGMGFLNAGAVVAPFVPIESYSGWLLDGSFGGPDADGVGVFNGNQQLCNWRNLLGGYQYGNVFPTFLGEWVGKGAVRWLYGNAYGETNYLLETFALDKGLGVEKTRQLIMEYRARLALLDMKKWSENLRTLLNDNFGSSAKAEWSPAASNPAEWKMTPYQNMSTEGDWLAPENRTTPGWSGANIVPLTIANNAKTVKVTFKALGENMSIQICYRATDGTPVYSTPMQLKSANETAVAVLNLDKAPQSNVVFAVICNTDFQYTGNKNIRLNHYDYRLQLTEGISAVASANTKWYNNFKLTYNWPELNDDYAPGASSSSTASSSSIKSSSSTQSSSSEISSSSVAMTIAKTFDVNVTLPINDNYTSVSANLNGNEVAKLLGLNSIAEIQNNVTYFAVEPNGNYNYNSTAHDPGHWFRKDGSVTTWGSNSSLFSQFDLAEMTTSIGNYPNQVTVGETYNFKQGLSYKNKAVIFNFNVTVAKSESEGGSDIIESSSSEAPEINVEIPDTTRFTVSATMPIDESYAAMNITLNINDLKKALGIESDDFSDVKFFAINADGTKQEKSTANDPGHWFDKNGNVVSWGENAYVFSEFHYSQNLISVGHYPNRVADGDVYKVTQGLQNGARVALYTITINVINSDSKGSAEVSEESSSSETINSSSSSNDSSSEKSSSSETIGSSNSSETSSSSTNAIQFKDYGKATNIKLSNIHGILEIHYNLSIRDNVKISLYTGYGALVHQTVSEIKCAGSHRESLNLEKMGLPQGTYIVKVSTGTYREAESITIVK